MTQDLIELTDHAEDFLRRVAEVPQTDIELEYLSGNVMYARGSLAKETRREAVVAIKTLRAILKDAKRLRAHREGEGR